MGKDQDRCICDCDECTHDGTWRIYILKEFWGDYGQFCGPYCDFCLMEEIQGVHTGGGLTSAVIDRIERITDSEAAQVVREWHFPIKTLHKMIAIAEAKKYCNLEFIAKLHEILTLNDVDKMNRWFGYYQAMGEYLKLWNLQDVITWVREEKAAK